MPDRLALAARLDTAAARPLAAMLLERLEKGDAIELGGGDVELVGLACLQVLAGAHRTAVSNGSGFLISDPSPPLIDGCVLAGLEALVRPA